MKRENTPAFGAGKKCPSPGLILNSASVWKKRDDAKPQGDVSAPSSQHWTRYIDSRLKQFGSR